MKKIISAIITIVLPLTILSCNNDSEKSENNGGITDQVKKENKITTDGSENDDKKDSNSDKVISEPVHLNKEMFLKKVMDYEKNPEKWIFKGELPCLIDFYADWCRPCKITGPIIDELAKEYAGKIHVYKINTEEQRELAAVFGIRSIPSFLYCPMDKKPSMASGIAKTPEETKLMFKQHIEELLLKDQ